MTYTYFAETVIWPFKKQAISLEKKKQWQRRISRHFFTIVHPVATWMEDFVALESRVEPMLPKVDQSSHSKQMNVL